MFFTVKRLIHIYAAGTLVAFLWIFTNFATWCPESDGELDLERTLRQQSEERLHNYKNSVDVLRLKIEELKSELKTSKNSANVANYKSYRLPFIYVVTATYARPEQKAELTRLSHTLRLVDNIHWIVVEDASQQTPLVANFLKRCTLSYTHLNAVTPEKVKLKSSDPNWLKPRGVPQRNSGIDWIRQEATRPGVAYFADDDNTYDLQLFNEMRYTEKVSVWPVGLVGYLKYESPVVSNGKVTGWYTFWKPNRAFAMDMAGFAVNIQLLKDWPEAGFRLDVGRGELESALLTQLGVGLDDLEPRADNCTKVLVWHTRTEKSSFKNEDKMLKKYGYNSDSNIEV